MAEVNTAGHAAVTTSTVMEDQTIGEFWQGRYLPWATENLRITTSRSYATIWAGYLEAELKNRPLREYKTVDASLFLTGLASRLNRNSLNHVKSLMSGIFTLAKNLGMVDQNPMQGCKALARVRAPKPQVAYSIPETVAILAAIEKPDAKLFFALCAVLSLRPSEAAGLRWENIVDGMVQIRGAAPYGIVGALKTEQSARDLELIEPVKTLLDTWRKACGSPTAGLIFTNEAGGAINHNDYAKKWIAPSGRKACARWHGCYSGRHGGATSLFNLTGDARAANQTLGNSLEVVMETYIKPSTAAGAAGQKLYEAAILEEMRKV
jgi:integrase